jgi:tetratricopeptide (TPR) repeat protein
MESRASRSLLTVVSSIVLVAGLFIAVSEPASAQQRKSPRGPKAAATKDEAKPPPSSQMGAATGKALNEAIELLNAENFSGASAKISGLNLEKLSPYERSKVEQILFNISFAQEKYGDARGHLQKAIDAGGLNEQEVQQARYQSAQLYMTEEKWKEGAAAIEEWLKSATNANSGAYYLLAVAYYQLEDYDRALPPAKKAVELMDPKNPQESWLAMLSSLYLQRDNYSQSIPVLQQLVSIAPDKKTYWLQLSSVYGQMKDYANSLAIMQLAYSAGLLTEDSEIRRLADLQMVNEIPYRSAATLEAGLSNKLIKSDVAVYEKLANSYIAAGEFDKSIAPLQRAAEMSSTGDIYVRLGEVQVQRKDWPKAIDALKQGLAKGQLKNAPNAQLMMGVAQFNQKNYAEATTWFERAQQSEKYRQLATGYLEAIRAQG